MVIISLRTFRLHDNPLLAYGSKITIIVDLKRIPKKDPYKEFVDSTVWSIPQAWLYLKCIEGHIKDLMSYGYNVKLVLSSNLAQDLKYMSKNDSKAIVDLAHDPAYDNIYKEINKKFSNVKYVETCTLVDWRKHKQEVDDAFSTPFKKTTNLKKYIRQNVIDPLPVPLKKKSIKFIQSKKLKALQQSIEKLAQTHNISLYPFDLLNCKTLDESILKFADVQIKKVKKPTWYKPSTARNVSLLEHPNNEKLDTSKMSPFFSIGALSVRTFYKKVRLNTWKLGTSEDQLLFRECWYVAAIQDERQRKKFWSNKPLWWKQRHGNFIDSKKSWTFQQNKDIEIWTDGEMSEKWVDANESMHLLFETGWIHHLRRHVVADVLCNRFEIHFLYGEAWFRRTLIDHDAVVNRANWMWLSASAFSTKQMVYHYSPVDYISRNSTDEIHLTKKIC